MVTQNVAKRAVCWPLAAVILVAMLVACSADPEDRNNSAISGSALTELVAVTVTLPSGSDPRRVGLGVAGDVYVADRAKLVSANRTWMPVTTNVGSQRTEIGAEASVGSIVSFASTGVFLRNRCIVNGDVFAKGPVTLQQGATVAGQIAQNQQTPPGVVDTAQFGWRVTLSTPSSTTVMVEPDQVRSLAGGSYGDVFVKSRALLDLSSAPRFRFRSLMVEPGGIIRVADGLPTEIYIQNTATFRGAITTPTAATPPPITMVIFGTGQMSIESTIRALMIAPQGKVVLGGIHRDFHGAVFARAVELRPDVILHHISFGLPPVTPGGGGPTPSDPPDVPDSFVSAAAHCGPRDRLSFSAWPIRGFCPAQLSLSPFNGTRTGELRWLTPLSSPPVAQPIVGSGADIHVVTEAAQLITLTSQGRMRWSASLAGVAAAEPTVLRNGDLVVPLRSGSVQLVGRDGRARWTASGICTGAPSAVTVDADGNLLVGCTEGEVSLLSASNGAAIWSTSTSSGVHQIVTVGNPGVILAATQTQLVRISRQGGSIVWAQGLSGAPVGPAVLVRDTAYVATADGSLRAITADGASRWQVSLGGAPSGALAVSPWGLLLVPMQSGAIIAVDATSGTVRTQLSFGSEPLTQVIVGSDGIAYAASSSRVIGIVPTTGRVLWTHALSGAPQGISLSDEGLVLATAGGAALAIGSNPNWTIGGGPGGDPPRGFDPGSCLAQKLATGVDVCDPGGPGWGDPTRIVTVNTGTGNPSVVVGQSQCVPPTPPANVTSQGLGGLGYLATQTNGVDTGQLTFDPPATAPQGCELRFCEEDAEGVEHVVNLPFSRIAQNPASLSGTTPCAAVEGGANCPVNPDSNTHRRCDEDSDCNAGEVCAVFCQDATCQVSETACGQRMPCTNSGLSAEPVGVFSEQDPRSWPCEELRECMETGSDFGASGDPDLRKTGSLENRSSAPASFTQAPSLLVPANYPNYASTLAADPCNASPLGGTENSQLDSRSGGSGNQKWGLFVEPDLSQKYEVELGDILAQPQIHLEAIGSFRAGARVWGKEIEIVNAKAEAVLATCSAHLMPSLTILGTQVQSWAAYASNDLPPAPEPPSDQDTLNCQNAVNALNDKLANLKKALYDARAAWDAYRRNGSIAPQALCDRTRAILGNVDPAGCTAESARAWLRRYQNLVRATETYIDTEYFAAAGTIANKAEGAITFAPSAGGPFADIGATTHYPVGPIVLTLEIEIAGDLDASGRLAYSMGLAGVDSAEGGPNVRIEAAPGAHVDAFVFVGAGIPGVSVGVEGQLRLIGVTAPLHASVGLARVRYLDPRPFDSSGVFAFVNGGPGLLRNGTMQKWNAKWGYGAGVVLDTLSGRINLAARVRLLFFKKTFRKKVAQWDGATKTFEFVGRLNQPLSGTAQSDVLMSNIPFPDGTGNLEAAFDATPIGPVLPVNTLGDTSAPGACSCVDLNKVCTTDSDCCNSYRCVPDIASEGAFNICIVPPPIIQ